MAHNFFYFLSYNFEDTETGYDEDMFRKGVSITDV